MNIKKHVSRIRRSRHEPEPLPLDLGRVIRGWSIVDQLDQLNTLHADVTAALPLGSRLEPDPDKIGKFWLHVGWGRHPGSVWRLAQRVIFHAEDTGLPFPANWLPPESRARIQLADDEPQGSRSTGLFLSQ